MTNDATLVSYNLAREVMAEVDCQLELGGPVAIEKALSDFEPMLARHIREEAERIAGQLAMRGAPTDVTNGAYLSALRLAIGSVQAMRKGHSLLWQDVILDAADRTSVVLLAVGERRSAVVEAIRAAKGCSAFIARALVADCPTPIADDLSPIQAARLVEDIQRAGGAAEIA